MRRGSVCWKLQSIDERNPRHYQEMQRHTMFIDRKITLKQCQFSPNSPHLTQSQLKSQQDFFCRQIQVDSKWIWKCKEIKIAKMISKMENRVGGNTLFSV